jgi:hypothetical protein
MAGLATRFPLAVLVVLVALVVNVTTMFQMAVAGNRK